MVYGGETPLNRQKVYSDETAGQVRQRPGYPDKIYTRSETVHWWSLFRGAFFCGSAYLHDEEPVLTEFRDRNYSGLREPQSVKNYKPLQLFCRNAASLAAFFGNRKQHV